MLTKHCPKISQFLKTHKQCGWLTVEPILFLTSRRAWAKYLTTSQRAAIKTRVKKRKLNKKSLDKQSKAISGPTAQSEVSATLRWKVGKRRPSSQILKKLRAMQAVLGLIRHYLPFLCRWRRGAKRRMGMHRTLRCSTRQRSSSHN